MENSIEDLIKGEPISVSWVKNPYTDRWFADPHILDATDDVITLLAEEYSFSLRRGRIARLSIDRHTKTIVEMNIVLEQSTHLSFPAILRRGNNIYIYPENSESGCLTLYRFDTNTNKCTPIRVLVEQPLTDATLLSIDKKTYLLSTHIPTPNGSTLSIYEFDELKKEFNFKNEVCFCEKIARNAGLCFTYKNNTYRPAQDCNDSYGHAVVLQEVHIDNGKFQFQNVRRLFSPSKRLSLGMHTFNYFEGIIIIDARGYRHYAMAKTARFIVSNLKRFFQ